MQFAGCAFPWPTATRFILGCYYRCKYNTTFTEKAAFFHTAELLLFPIHLWTPASLSCLWWLHPGAAVKMSLSGPVSSEAVLFQREDESFKAKLLSGVQSFWQQFLNVLISRTPSMKKMTVRTPSWFVPRFAIWGKIHFAASSTETAGNPSQRRTYACKIKTL